MSSVLKRLRETAEMREHKLHDRRDYRYMKFLSQREGRAQRYVEQLTPPKKDDDEDVKRARARERSRSALAELHRGSRLKHVVRALRTFFGRED